MSIPSTQVIASWVKDAITDDKWTPLREVSLLALRNRWERGDEEILDLLEDKLSFIAEHLRDDLAECFIDGRIRIFEIDEETPPYIRRVTAVNSELLGKLRRISPYAFEEVCSRVLTALGAQARVTQKTNDGGVDFVATGLKTVPIMLPMPQSCHGVVIGQAKRYKEGSQISETRLREFVGASMLERHKLGLTSGVGPLTPTIFAFWTTSDLDRNARVFARNVGLWYMDGSTFSSYCDELGLFDHVMALPDDPRSS